MDRATPRFRTIRDDIDRILIVGALVWIWFLVPPLALVPGVFAGYALFLNRAWARAPLVATALLASAVGTWMALGAGPAGTRDPFLVLGAVVPGMVIAVVGAQVRIGPPLDPVSRPRPGLPVGELAAPPASYADIADDPALLQFLDDVGHLDREAPRRLAAAWRAVDPAGRVRAWAAVKDALDASGRHAVLEDVRRQVELWGRSAGGSPWTWEFGTMTDVDRSNLRRAAMPALVDVAAAILLRDHLAVAELEILACPWEAAVVAEPVSA